MQKNGAAATGYWAFDEETLQRVADRWDLIAEKCEQAYKESRPLIEVEPPGLDPASCYYAKKANASGADYRRMVLEVRDYARAQAHAAKNGLGIYQRAEDAQLKTLSKAAQQ